MKNEDPWEQRPEFHAATVSLLECSPANDDHADGRPNAIVTITRKDLIMPLVFNLDDSRKLATGLLVALATNDDEFAAKLLDENFEADEEHNFRWPGPRSG